MDIATAIKANTAIAKHTITSIIASLATAIGCSVAEDPKINSMLNMLEPTTLPIASPLSPFFAATIDVTSSGREVPIATIVSATSRWLMPKLTAILLALSTTNCPPNITAAKPPMINSTLIIGLRVFSSRE